MNNNAFYKSLLVVIGILFLSVFSTQIFNHKSPFNPPLFIAHASGGIDGRTYLNSLEALNHNYQLGHRYFEVDFSWTSDNELVLIHDWKQSYKRLFNNHSKQAPSQSEFLKLEMAYNQTQLSLTQFAQWMKTHPEAIVIADVKSDFIQGLQKLLASIENPYNRIIPQVYHPRNYEKIVNLGFKNQNIMFAMYRQVKLTDETLNFIRENTFFAISIQPSKGYFHTILKQFGSSKIPIYTLTVNNLETFKEYQSLGVDGTVTDFLYLKDKKILIQN